MRTAVMGLAWLTMPVAAQPGALIGQNGWLFYRYEWAQASDAADTRASLRLLQKAQRHFARNQVAMVLALVPSKIRIYADQLPPAHKLDPYTDGKYTAAVNYLREHQVAVADLNQAFLHSPLRLSDTPLFLRLDSHWSPAGALLAAQTIQAEVARQPDLSGALESTPQVAYDLVWAKQKVIKRERDLIAQLPKGAPEFAPELVLPYKAQLKTPRPPEPDNLLQSSAPPVGVTAIGSSYTDAANGYPDALRHALQRDVLDISIPVLQGPWVGMDAYVRDPAFQSNRPKLLIWEIPERELRSPPNYRFREARYIMDNQHWLLRTAAWVQQSCQPAPVEIQSGSTGPNQLLLRFSAPLQALDYVQVTLSAQRARHWQMQARNPAGASQQWSQNLPNDDQAMEMRLTPAPMPGGISQLQITAAQLEQAKNWRICRLPADLLE
jgi:alginate O-acetyltransferase complex protein AlgJ